MDDRDAMQAAVEALELCKPLPGHEEAWSAAINGLYAALDAREEPAGYWLHPAAVAMLVDQARKFGKDRVTFGVMEDGAGPMGLPAYRGVVSESVENLLAASPVAAPVEARPVAWRWKENEGDDWRHTGFKPQRPDDLYRCEDLYASPVAADTQGDAQDAARDVLAERQRQVAREGYTTAHDDEHTDGELSAAAAAYAWAAGCNMDPHGVERYEPDAKPPKMWPWDDGDWKPGDVRRMLVKSGALLLAEIERIDRAAMKEQPSDGAALGGKS